MVKHTQAICQLQLFEYFQLIGISICFYILLCCNEDDQQCICCSISVLHEQDYLLAQFCQTAAQSSFKLNIPSTTPCSRPHETISSFTTSSFLYKSATVKLLLSSSFSKKAKFINFSSCEIPFSQNKYVLAILSALPICKVAQLVFHSLYLLIWIFFYDLINLFNKGTLTTTGLTILKKSFHVFFFSFHSFLVFFLQPCF